jgi:GMP synthase (glutamine-hydrolysing)
MKDKILIIDFGSQYTQLIARRIREIGVYCEIFPFSTDASKIKDFNPKAIILSGGADSVNQLSSPFINPIIFDLKIPILGVCYGLQILATYFKGEVSLGNSGEFGETAISINRSSPIFDSLNNVDITVWMSHYDSVKVLPAGFVAIAASAKTKFAAISDEDNKIYGVQFHPEVTHTPEGMQILRNFVTKIAKCKSNWEMADFVPSTIDYLKSVIGDSKVICALSGGVDSTVASTLINKAIGNQLICIFVDSGLLRKHEANKIKTIFKEKFHFNLQVVNAQKQFFAALKGISDPEKKRKAIGKTFIEIFTREAKKLGDIKYLAQGTIYPDRIESVSHNNSKPVTIKSHHNVGGLPKKLNLKLIEPLKELFKDEVRKVGGILSIDPEITNNHPFPGVGLAVRIIGEVTQKKCLILQNIDFIYIEELKKARLYNKIWQAFAVLLPIKTVGVMGDNRTHKYVCSLRAVTSIDGMTADFFEMPWDVLKTISNRIVNEVKEVNRVTYDITSKPPATIEWE